LAIPKLFDTSAIHESIIQRKQWTRSLPFTFASILEQHPAHQLGQEFPLDHSRFDMLGPIGPRCLDLESYGTGDDEKHACALKSLQANKSDCIIISIGSNNAWGFEESIYMNLPHCRIETFDCTIPASSKPPATIADKTTFHHICVGDTDQTTNDGRRYLSWPSVLKLIRANQAPLYLKMDIEGYEYPVLRSIVSNGTLLPLQIAFEMHYATGIPLSWQGRLKSSGELATFMEYLHYEGGYFLIDRHDIHNAQSCLSARFHVDKQCTGNSIYFASYIPVPHLYNVFGMRGGVGG
jgi:hypothetical protein